MLSRKLECFPDAHYLHVVRDPDDVGRSLARAPFIGETDAAVCAGLARRAEAEIRAALAGHPRARELRYEDLAADPVGVMKGIYSWLGLPPEQEGSGRVKRLSMKQFAPMTGVGGQDRSGPPPRAGPSDDATGLRSDGDSPRDGPARELSGYDPR